MMPSRAGAGAGTAAKAVNRRQHRYIVGIDLGTTNTVVAYARADVPPDHPEGAIALLAIEQLDAPGEVRAAPLLPSLRYHPAPGELSPADLALPWLRQPAEAPVTGLLARRLGSQVPGRLVSSAKSWLSHAAVDRLAPILPWGAAADVDKVSPVDASAAYLAHVRAAWDRRFPAQPLERQEIVLTVPASFDEAARELTLRAARQAGLAKLRLIEEPQAAFYDWLFRHRDDLAASLAQTRKILICDVGGGTTDLSLIEVSLAGGEPELTRTGVGSHLMLGGDNMDLVLAHLAESRLARADERVAPPGENTGGGGGGGDFSAANGAASGENAPGGPAPGEPPPAPSAPVRLSASRLFQLMERCRAAKERLLAVDAPESVQVTLLGSGSRLIGATRSATLTREDVQAVIVDNFFPRVEAGARPAGRRGGLVEFGLPYASDAAISRHIAAFLSQHGEMPDALLLNGGVFRAAALSERLQQILAGWRGAPLRLLHNDDPDVAVARGAVAYALAQKGLAPKIGGGSARNYFLLLEDAGKPLRRAVCLLARGAEAEREILLSERSFALRIGRPVRFNVVTTTQDDGQPAHLPGQLVELDMARVEHLPPVAAVLDRDSGGKTEIPVLLATRLTEVGTLEIFCVAQADAAQRWLLEFQLRGDEPVEAEPAQRLPQRVGEAIERIDRIFGPRQGALPVKEVRRLRLQLEALLGSRERWPTILLRQLFDALWERARGRRRSADHERLWLNLAGFCLRPGYGRTLDDWRVAQCWSLFESGLQHGADNQVKTEWWTLWRRIAGGLERDAQLRLLQDFAFNLQADEKERRNRPSTLVEGSADDMLRLAASLERIPAEYKVEIGEWVFKEIGKLSAAPAPAVAANLPRMLWAIGRIGARQPFYGSAHDAVDAATAAVWLERLLEMDWKKSESAGFAAAHLARLTGDRQRDLAPEQREKVVRRLNAMRASPTWAAMVREVVQLDEAAQGRVLGEALPPGLKLLA